MFYYGGFYLNHSYLFDIHIQPMRLFHYNENTINRFQKIRFYDNIPHNDRFKVKWNGD